MSAFLRRLDARIDYSLIMPVLFLLFVGIYSIFVAVSHDYPSAVLTMVGTQVLWIVIGLTCAFVLMFFSTKFLYALTPWLYLLGLVLMVLPLVFSNPQLVAATGSKNWVSIGGLPLFQPSELMKIAYILIMARAIVGYTDRHRLEERTIKKDWYLIGELSLISLPIFILLALQHDLGTALVFFAIYCGLVLVSGVSWKILLPIGAGGLGAVLTFFLIFLNKDGRAFLHQMGLPTYQINRLLAWLNPFQYAQTTTYQQAQGQIAVGTGGLWGQGVNMTNLNIPVRESDMIFTVIAENFGFMGSLLLILLYTLVIVRMMLVTLRSHSAFYTYISSGFMMMLLFHIFENIGAVTGLLPLTGIPLPFISQGGSSIISNLIGIGIVLSMSYQNKKKAEERTQSIARREKLL